VVKIEIWVKTDTPFFAKANTCTNKKVCSVNIGSFDPADIVKFYAKAWDAAGNVAQSTTGSFTIPH
jgi:hypothetical protein